MHHLQAARPPQGAPPAPHAGDTATSCMTISQLSIQPCPPTSPTGHQHGVPHPVRRPARRRRRACAGHAAAARRGRRARPAGRSLGAGARAVGVPPRARAVPQAGQAVQGGVRAAQRAAARRRAALRQVRLDARPLDCVCAPPPRPALCVVCGARSVCLFLLRAPHTPRSMSKRWPGAPTPSAASVALPPGARSRHCLRAGSGH